MTVAASLKYQVKARPVWMQGLFVFCLYMTFIYLPWDIFIKPLAEDQEVWFGILFTGWAAKFGALLHWFVYGAGSYGYWKMKSWMRIGSVLYLLQIAIGMFVWSMLDERGGGLLFALGPATFFAALAFLSWRAKAHFVN